MPYALCGLDGNWYDPLTSAVSSGVSQVATSAASSAAPELQRAVVGAVNQVLPNVKRALSDGLAEGATEIVRRNAVLFLGLGIGFASFAIGTIVLNYLQYRKLSQR